MSTWQVTLKWNLDGQQARNVLHYRGISDLNPSWPDILQEFAVAWSGGLAASYGPGTLFTGINVLEVGPGNVSLDYDLVSPGLPGTGTDDPNATQVASLVTLIGALPVKPARGRIFLPAPITTNLGTSPFYSGTHTDRVNTWMGNIAQLDDTEGATFQLVIYSRTFPTGGGIQQNDVGSWIVRATPSTQRRRKIGVGS